MKIFDFFKDVTREMRKVTWPKSRELVKYTVTVIVTVSFIALFFFVIDIGITQALNNLPFVNN